MFGKCWSYAYFDGDLIGNKVWKMNNEGQILIFKKDSKVWQIDDSFKMVNSSMYVKVTQT
jgi:hypothetical protein